VAWRSKVLGQVAAQSEDLHPGEHVAGQGDNRRPDAVPGDVVQGDVAQPGVLDAPDAVFDVGAAAVA
jgi:hypothetical protein